MGSCLPANLGAHSAASVLGDREPPGNTQAFWASPHPPSQQTPNGYENARSAAARRDAPWKTGRHKLHSLPLALEDEDEAGPGPLRAPHDHALTPAWLEAPPQPPCAFIYSAAMGEAMPKSQVSLRIR